ncbi:hypothetical protein MMC11_008949 [Xylographa trunciseda]|nr:hypothetical protein [Xylographa trunciseda]
MGWERKDVFSLVRKQQFKATTVSMSAMKGRPGTESYDEDQVGLGALVTGHSDNVNAVKFLPQTARDVPILISGSADKTVRLWRGDRISSFHFENAAILEAHSSSINCLAVVAGSNLIASGAADATVKIWQIAVSESSIEGKLVQTISLLPRFFPLALALTYLQGSATLILAVGGTKSSVQIYVADTVEESTSFANRATLTGHEGWIRSLDFVEEAQDHRSDLLLASASQDKYIRLWRVHEGEALPATGVAVQDPSLGNMGKSLSNKAHRFEAAGSKYSLTFEALLLGHEDWIYTATWNRNGEKLQLLSASADNSLAMWESDPSSGVWVCTTRLGEISAQKGSTTATGSTGGFYIGLWSPDGSSVVSLGKTGSWRLWTHNADQDRWLQRLGLTGHVKHVKGVAWAKGGSYLLSTSSDQTTRLHAEWKRGTNRSWHEFARPQIHGYDLNCIDSIGDRQFISGADEKLLRVFDEPAAVAQVLEKLCGITRNAGLEMPEAANIPVLGLSNKAVEVLDDEEPVPFQEDDGGNARDPATTARNSTSNLEHPPLEDQLARHTLWPEREKLYGHGYEISSVAASNDGTLVATACKASSVDHAVIRLYETQEWREIGPPLVAHLLTVTCIRFSADDKMLLSVGRDRQWAVFAKRAGQQSYTLKMSNPKGHSRMILSATWAPMINGRSFATAGRDKVVKIWTIRGDVFECNATIQTPLPVTSVDFFSRALGDELILAVGAENGDLVIQSFRRSTFEKMKTFTIDRKFCSSLSINQLAWRPPQNTALANSVDDCNEGEEALLLAVASEDSSLRVLSLKYPP